MANNESRFQFPGFRQTMTQDTQTHQVEIGRVEDGGAVFTLHLIRNAMYTNLSFLLTKIVGVDGSLLWNFKEEQFDGVGVLAKAGDNVAVALVGRGKAGKVERVIPLAKFVSLRPMDLRQLMQMKRLAAEFLGRDYVLSEIEKTLMAADNKRRKAEAEKAERLAEEARKDARIERTKRILARGQVTGFTAEGARRYGLPVLETEWPSLSNGTYVIVVESFDEKTRKVGPTVEAFQVVKVRGKNPQKGFPAAVTATKPVVTIATTGTSGAKAPQPTKTIIAEKDDGGLDDGGVYEVQIFASMDAIRQARAAGLNGGALVAVAQRAIGEKIQVFSVHSDRMDTMGNFTPIT